MNIGPRPLRRLLTLALAALGGALCAAWVVPRWQLNQQLEKASSHDTQERDEAITRITEMAANYPWIPKSLAQRLDEKKYAKPAAQVLDDLSQFYTPDRDIRHVIAFLQHQFDSDEPRFRSAAYRKLEQYTSDPSEELIAVLRHGIGDADNEVAKEALIVAANLPEANFDPFVAQVHQNGRGELILLAEQCRKFLAGEKSASDPMQSGNTDIAIKHLAAAIADNDAQRMIDSMWQLKGAGLLEAVEPIESLLAHPLPMVGCVAAEVLTSIDVERGLPLLLGLLGSDHPSVRLRAARLLPLYSNAIADAALFHLLSSFNDDERSGAAMAIAALGRTDLIGEIQRRVEYEDQHDVRGYYQCALLMLGADSELENVLQLAQFAVFNRLAAWEALLASGRTEPLEILFGGNSYTIAQVDEILHDHLFIEVINAQVPQLPPLDWNATPKQRYRQIELMKLWYRLSKRWLEFDAENSVFTVNRKDMQAPPG